MIHGAVQKENEKLRNELKQAQQPASLAEEELIELREEFSRRLGTADQTIACLQASEQGLYCRQFCVQNKYALHPLSCGILARAAH